MVIKIHGNTKTLIIEYRNYKSIFSYSKLKEL
jgi:hypothetical protein